MKFLIPFLFIFHICNAQVIDPNFKNKNHDLSYNGISNWKISKNLRNNKKIRNRPYLDSNSFYYKLYLDSANLDTVVIFTKFYSNKLVYFSTAIEMSKLRNTDSILKYLKYGMWGKYKNVGKRILVKTPSKEYLIPTNFRTFYKIKDTELILIKECIGFPCSQTERWWSVEGISTNVSEVFSHSKVITDILKFPDKLYLIYK